MQKSVKTDISEAITPTPVIRFQEDRPCHAVQRSGYDKGQFWANLGNCLYRYNIKHNH